MEEQTFDLASVRQSDYPSPRRASRAILAAIALLALGLTLLSGVRAALGTLRLDTNSLAAMVVGIAAFALLLLATFALAPGPIAATLDPTGFALVYEGGKRRRFDFTLRSTKLSIYIVSVKGDPTDAGPMTRHFLLGGIPYRNPLTATATDALLAVAGERGMKVVRHPPRPSVGTRRVRVEISSGLR